MSKEGGARFLKSKESGIIPYHRVMDAIRDKRIRPYILPLVLSGVVAGGVFVLLTSYYGSNPIVAAATIALFVGLLAFFKVKRGQGD